MKSIMKNIDQAKVLSLAAEVDYLPLQIVSKTLAQNSHYSLTLFAFDSGEEIGAHTSKGDALVAVLDGVAQVVIEDKEFILKTGESIVMPANVYHSVHAKERFKMLLTVLF